jgi:hypothetical protein
MSNECPECRAPPTQFIKDELRSELICGQCGLVLRGSYNYVGGKQITYPFGGLITDKRQPYTDRKYHIKKSWKEKNDITGPI